MAKKKTDGEPQEAPDTNEGGEAAKSKKSKDVDRVAQVSKRADGTADQTAGYETLKGPRARRRVTRAQGHESTGDPVRKATREPGGEKRDS